MQKKKMLICLFIFGCGELSAGPLCSKMRKRKDRRVAREAKIILGVLGIEKKIILASPLSDNQKEELIVKARLQYVDRLLPVLQGNPRLVCGFDGEVVYYRFIDG